MAVYSLSLSEPLDRTMPLKAITASTSAIPHLDQITSLVRNSAEDSKRGTLTDARAAAYQVAIWHLADDLPIDRYHVRNAAIRSVALELLRTSAGLTDQINKCAGNECPAALSTAATTAALSLQVGNTVGDSTLSISIVTPIQNVFNQRQYVNLRVNGLGATVCPGETDRIRVDLPVTHNVRKSSCNFLSHDPTQRGLPKTASLPRLILQRISTVSANSVVNNTITVRIPRQDSAQQIQANWQFDNDPGMIFIPTSPASPVITASSFEDTRTAAATIEPADFASFQEVIQRTVLPLFTERGIWGLILLGLLFVLLLVLKDWVVRFTNWLGRILRRPWDSAWERRKKNRLARRVAILQSQADREGPKIVGGTDGQAAE